MSFSDSRGQLALALLLVWGCQLSDVSPLSAMESAIPLGEDPEEVEHYLPPDDDRRLELVGTASWDSERGSGRRGLLSLGLPGVAGVCLVDPNNELPRRWGGRIERRGWALGVGRLNGISGGILTGKRVRRSLGSIGAPVSPPRQLSPSTSSDPEMVGVALQGDLRGWSMELRLARREATASRPGEEGRVLGLVRRSWRVTLFDSPLLRGLALRWGGSGADSPVAVEIATAGPPDRVLNRRGFLWRFRESHRGVQISIETMVITGSRGRARLPNSWLTGEGGQELHLSLGGTTGAGSWRLARRIRNGLGSGEENRRVETGLVLRSPLVGGRLGVKARRLEAQGRIRLEQAPGFSRSVPVASINQELGLQWRRGVEVEWLWRGGDGVGGTLLNMKASPVGRFRPRLALSVFDLDPGIPPFMAFSGGGLHRSLVALRGSGWRLGISGLGGGKWFRGRVGASIVYSNPQGFRLSSWLEIGN